jgi:acetylornithine deacetylase/succinyl-diaminopimelate desuccinylase-like protein
MNPLPASLIAKVQQAVQRQRLVDTAVRLIAVPSRTGEAGAVADCLAQLLREDGFPVERPAAGHPAAPAVVVRWSPSPSPEPSPSGEEGGKRGRTLQFNGHIDTVHLPFVPPKVEDGKITGSGSSDMKAGTAAAVEALRVLRETGLLAGGSILLTAHDLHESPWGDGSQLNQLIAEGYVGDAVLLPEYLHDRLPIIGRGGLTWRATIRRSGPPIHEVMRPAEPSVIAAGAELVRRLVDLDGRLAALQDPVGGKESLFIGQIHSGEIFNQYPQECFIEGTRRWLPGTQQADVERQLRAVFDDVAGATGTTVVSQFNLMRDAFLLNLNDQVVKAFQDAHTAETGQPLPTGAKPFCDDGNSFWALANVPAITHGPRAGGAHTLNEWVSIDDLVRVATVYALTAIQYCGQAATSSERE